MTPEALDLDIQAQIASGNNTLGGIANALSDKYQDMADMQPNYMTVKRMVRNRLKRLMVRGAVRVIQARRVVKSEDGKIMKSQIQKSWVLVRSGQPGLRITP